MVGDPFADVSGIVEDLQCLQAHTSAEGTVFDIVHALGDRKFCELGTFAECPLSNQFQLKWKLQLLKCTEIKSFLTDLLQLL